MANKVFLSAGHGGSDPGAVGNGLKEKDINLQVLKTCRDELERHGVEVVCSREKDENDPVGQEVREANESESDLAVSFHINAGGGDGFEAFYWDTNKNAKKLAELGEKYVKALGQNSRGLKSGNHLYFIKNTDMTSVLFESFFIDSKDKNIGDTIAEQKAFGVAYAKAILEYFGIKYKAKTDSKTTTKTTKKTTKKDTSFKVKITATLLNVRAGAGSNYKINAKVKKGEVYTIVSQVGDWGKLKSGVGYIHLDYTKRI